MKKIKVLVMVFVSFVFGGSFAQADQVTADSRITQVTVYQGSALVTRSATVQLPAGAQQIIFDDIIPEIDENTIRVSGSGNARVKLFGAQLKREFFPEVVSEKAKSLEREIQDLEDKKMSVIGEQQVVMQEREFLNSLRFFSQRQLPEDMITKMPTSKDVGDMLAYLDAELKKNFAAAQANDLKVREIDKKLDVLRQELDEVSSGQKTKRAIAVDVEAPSAVSFDVNVSYMVMGAFWRPVYDARAAFDKGLVDLVTYGVVKQTTGEDWTDVDMTLSTSKPSISGRMPYVAPWFLRFLQFWPGSYVNEKKLMKGQHAPMGVGTSVTVMDGKIDAYSMSAEAPRAEATDVYAQVGQSGTGVTYKIARKAIVKADGSDYRLPVGAVVLKSDFRYTTYPKASSFAYLNTTVRNEGEMQLPAGSMSVFLDGDFVGRSSIDNVSPGEKFDLYLGIDENVKVKRERLEQKTDDTLVGGIPAPTVKVTTTYRISVENYKTKDISVYVFESMPVSEDERIKTKIISVKPDPKEKDWEKRKGVWRWEFDLKPREKKEIFYTYIVEYPRNAQVEGL